MNIKDLHIALIEHLEAYRHELGDPESASLDDFIQYVGSRQPSMSPRERLHVEIPKNLCFLYRYVKLYMKKVIKGTNLQTDDEYTYLISLMSHESLTKTELNNMNVMEKTSGTEIIKRLVRKGLVEEWDDENDKRSKRVGITEQGRRELLRILPALNSASNIICASLDEHAQGVFNDTLKRLNAFHEQVLHAMRADSIEEIEAAVCKRQPRQQGE